MTNSKEPTIVLIKLSPSDMDTTADRKFKNAENNSTKARDASASTMLFS